MSETVIKPAALAAGYMLVLVMLKIAGRCRAF